MISGEFIFGKLVTSVQNDTLPDIFSCLSSFHPICSSPPVHSDRLPFRSLHHQFVSNFPEPCQKRQQPGNPVCHFRTLSASSAPRRNAIPFHAFFFRCRQQTYQKMRGFSLFCAALSALRQPAASGIDQVCPGERRPPPQKQTVPRIFLAEAGGDGRVASKEERENARVSLRSIKQHETTQPCSFGGSFFVRLLPECSLSNPIHISFFVQPNLIGKIVIPRWSLSLCCTLWLTHTGIIESVSMRRAPSLLARLIVQSEVRKA